MYKISPSDFAFLYEECKLCYVLKVKYGIYQPSMPMPGVFTAINTRVQSLLVGKSLRTLSPGLPEGEVVKQEGWVESVVVPNTSLYIKGKYDLLVKKVSGEYILVDLKISQPQDDKIEKYKTQLGAYAFALEHPKSGDPISITRTGLLVFYPDAVSFVDGEALLHFPPRWLEVPVDTQGFLSFARQVDTLLAGPTPAEGSKCKWCQYRHKGDTVSHVNLTVSGGQDIPF